VVLDVPSQYSLCVPNLEFPNQRDIAFLRKWGYSIAPCDRMRNNLYPPNGDPCDRGRQIPQVRIPGNREVWSRCERHRHGSQRRT